MLSAQLIEQVKRDFPTEHQSDVINWLENECGRNLPLCKDADEQHLNRIRTAILRLSNGDVEKFLYWLEVAKLDWRDVLSEQAFDDRLKKATA